jgi:cell division protein FtsB
MPDTERRRAAELAAYEETLEAVTNVRRGITWLFSKKALIGFMLALMGFLGIQVLWPRERFKALEEGQVQTRELIRAQAGSTEARVAKIEDRQDAVEEIVQLRRTDPAAVPAECNAQLLRGGP